MIKDLVLVGGGHSHVAVIRSFGMRPIPGLRVTLISRGYDTPYSGMLPGVVAGHYSPSQAFIDLAALCQRSGVRFICEEVCGLDPTARTIDFHNRPSLGYDFVSLNIGSTPATDGGVGLEVNEATIVTKPIDRFLAKWDKLSARLNQKNDAARILIVGGGVAGVELALSVRHRFRAMTHPPTVHLVTATDHILPTHNRRVRRRLLTELSTSGIKITTGSRVSGNLASGFIDGKGHRFETDAVIWATHAAAAPWVAQSSLATDSSGFVAVNRYLQSVSHAEVFAAGDIASREDNPRPKAGVFAVRQGKALAINLRRVVLGHRLLPYQPQRNYLSLISTGRKHAIASRGQWALSGDWLWRMKDMIDRRFIDRFSVLGNGPLPPADTRESAKMLKRIARLKIPTALTHLVPRPEYSDGMRCAGCGAKVASTVLSKSLSGIESTPHADIPVGLNAPDDAAIVDVAGDSRLAFSVDVLRPIVSDPFLFGKITAQHCLNDLYAVGAEPVSALTVVSLPAWPEDKLIAELSQMLLGAEQEFNAAGARIVGGHTSEAHDVSLGFSVTGKLVDKSWFSKTGVVAGDRLVLTKPLGTGVLFAAAMRGFARGAWIDAACRQMLQSNAAAARLFAGCDAHAVTDVSGFGLAGHLAEMLRDSNCQAHLDVSALPLLLGAGEVVSVGWRSSLHRSNVAAIHNTIEFSDDAMRHENLGPAAILFDPQTSGGLLASIPESDVTKVLQDLADCGFEGAAVVGEIVDKVAGAPKIVLR